MALAGLKIIPKSYAAAVADGKDEEEQDGSMEEQIAEFLKEKNIEFDTEDIEACYSLSRKAKTGIPAILMKFVNREKNSLLRRSKMLKGSKVFINENLTKQNAEIAMKARKARKVGKIQGTWTINGKIYIKLKGTLEEAKVAWIRNVEELDKYCQ